MMIEASSKGPQGVKANATLETGRLNGGGAHAELGVNSKGSDPIQAEEAALMHSPQDATRQLTVHPELTVQLFASEPIMFSPSSIDIDHRGRVWVCEVVNYRKHNGERAEGDRILILEDTDGDAKADKSTVFHQGRDEDSAHGICVLGNKALISCGDDVFWLIDDNGDDKADRKELMFTKIGGAQHDHGIHAFHFGPDGRLYFNFGNACKQLCNAKGELITDIHGIKCTNQNNLPYQDGMVFRCELDGSKVEMLAWNFRNNWEVAVDSFGTMWQSDNDDDGNKGVRINYLMEFGNYGFKDEMTGAGWQVPRIGLESEIPRRHWHLNDPGVVPNMLQTGAGSPTGMIVYEGDLLPSIFHGQPIHCDAGPNVVRAYITQPVGAGYKAEVVNIIEGTQNRWFRPSDVAVAPDGSLIVADWYDPGVGGHGMGDVTHGRLFRVTTKTALKYQISNFNLDSPETAMAALKSPNEEVRYLAWKALKKQDGAQALMKLFDDAKALPQHRARGLWALAWLSRAENELNQASSSSKLGSEGPSCLQAALTDPDPNLRITALRIARQQWGQAAPEKIREIIAKLVADKSLAVRREAAIALRFDASEEASKLWAQLTPKNEWHRDRFFLEAQGIGADLQWADRLAALSATPIQSSGNVRSLQWRSRAESSSEALVLMSMGNPEGQWDDWLAKPAQRLRALQILQTKYPAEVERAALSILLKAEPETALAATSLLDRGVIESNTNARRRLDEIIRPVIGKPEFISLVERLNLSAFRQELLDYILAHPEAQETITAAKLLAADKNETVALLRSTDAEKAKFLVMALGKTSERHSVSVLNAAFNPTKRELIWNSIYLLICTIVLYFAVWHLTLVARQIIRQQAQHLPEASFLKPSPWLGLGGMLAKVFTLLLCSSMSYTAFWPGSKPELRQAIVQALALSSEGGKAILKLNDDGVLTQELKESAALALSRSADASLRDQAVRALPMPAAQGVQDFPPLADLMKFKGDASKGQSMFMQAGCVACHQVKGQFINFGPDLSQIGNKLSQEGLFTAVLYPSAAVEHSFNGLSLTTKEGQITMGYIISETADELTLRINGGASMVIKKSGIAKKEEMKVSLMPPGLAAAIGPQGLVDLVTYLQTLK
jgi:putative membrane-bound dehydrogenase-like protein